MKNQDVEQRLKKDVEEITPNVIDSALEKCGGVSQREKIRKKTITILIALFILLLPPFLHTLYEDFINLVPAELAGIALDDRAGIRHLTQ